MPFDTRTLVRSEVIRRCEKMDFFLHAHLFYGHLEIALPARPFLHISSACQHLHHRRIVTAKSTLGARYTSGARQAGVSAAVTGIGLHLQRTRGASPFFFLFNGHHVSVTFGNNICQFCQERRIGPHPLETKR